MKGEDWAMLTIAGLVILSIVGLLSFEDALLLVLMNMAAIMADYSAEH